MPVARSLKTRTTTACLIRGIAIDVLPAAESITDRCPSGLRFSDQMTCGSCSGTLIAPDLVATAGHCVNSGSCSGKRIVFGATNLNVRAGNAIPSDTLYSCDSVVISVPPGNGQDWAVIRLDRAVPAAIATPAMVGTTQMPPGTGLMLIGHPSGLPRKYADDASVVTVSGGGSDSLAYRTNLDAFGGNSGSGVFTTGATAGDTCYPAGLMVGILVNGATDYDSNGCPTTYTQGEAGEGVSGALTLEPYASSIAASTTPVTCGATAAPPPPTVPPPPTAPPPPTNEPETLPPGESSGELTCGSSVSGDTTGAVHVVGATSGEHHYSVTVAATTTYTFVRIWTSWSL